MLRSRWIFHDCTWPDPVLSGSQPGDSRPNRARSGLRRRSELSILGRIADGDDLKPLESGRRRALDTISRPRGGVGLSSVPATAQTLVPNHIGVHAIKLSQ